MRGWERVGKGERRVGKGREGWGRGREGWGEKAGGDEGRDRKVDRKGREG